MNPIVEAMIHGKDDYAMLCDLGEAFFSEEGQLKYMWISGVRALSDEQWSEIIADAYRAYTTAYNEVALSMSANVEVPSYVAGEKAQAQSASAALLRAVEVDDG
jgi:hypothetical protein